MEEAYAGQMRWRGEVMEKEKEREIGEMDMTSEEIQKLGHMWEGKVFSEAANYGVVDVLQGRKAFFSRGMEFKEVDMKVGSTEPKGSVVEEEREANGFRIRVDVLIVKIMQLAAVLYEIVGWNDMPVRMKTLIMSSVAGSLDIIELAMIIYYEWVADKIERCNGKITIFTPMKKLCVANYRTITSKTASIGAGTTVNNEFIEVVEILNAMLTMMISVGKYTKQDIMAAVNYENPGKVMEGVVYERTKKLSWGQLCVAKSVQDTMGKKCTQIVEPVQLKKIIQCNIGKIFLGESGTKVWEAMSKTRLRDCLSRKEMKKQVPVSPNRLWLVYKDVMHVNNQVYAVHLDKQEMTGIMYKAVGKENVCFEDISRAVVGKKKQQECGTFVDFTFLKCRMEWIRRAFGTVDAAVRKLSEMHRQEQSEVIATLERWNEMSKSWRYECSVFERNVQKELAKKQPPGLTSTVATSILELSDLRDENVSVSQELYADAIEASMCAERNGKTMMAPLVEMYISFVILAKLCSDQAWVLVELSVMMWSLWCSDETVRVVKDEKLSIEGSDGTSMVTTAKNYDRRKIQQLFTQSSCGTNIEIIGKLIEPTFNELYTDGYYLKEWCLQNIKVVGTERIQMLATMMGDASSDILSVMQDIEFRMLKEGNLMDYMEDVVHYVVQQNPDEPIKVLGTEQASMFAVRTVVLGLAILTKAMMKGSEYLDDW
jgi:hypothetical protein